MVVLLCFDIHIFIILNNTCLNALHMKYSEGCNLFLEVHAISERRPNGDILKGQ